MVLWNCFTLLIWCQLCYRWLGHVQSAGRFTSVSEPFWFCLFHFLWNPCRAGHDRTFLLMNRICPDPTAPSSFIGNGVDNRLMKWSLWGSFMVKIVYKSDLSLVHNFFLIHKYETLSVPISYIDENIIFHFVLSS